jgi:rRNA maturation protein Nop10
MTSVEATCPSCGGVCILPDQIVVRVCVDLESSAYTFQCPECGLRAVKPATERIVDLLTSVGASLEVWYLPEELREPRPGGAPISHDDLLDFHLLLQDRGWFGRLEQLVAGDDDLTVRPESRRGGSFPFPGDWRSRPFRRGPRYGP